jgi:hypothetical protein
MWMRDFSDSMFSQRIHIFLFTVQLSPVIVIIIDIIFIIIIIIMLFIVIIIIIKMKIVIIFVIIIIVFVKLQIPTCVGDMWSVSLELLYRSVCLSFFLSFFVIQFLSN